MNIATANKIEEHYYECGSHEYEREYEEVNGNTVLIYKCKKCNAQIRAVTNDDL